ncbi:MAG: aminodeoxychorismate synthase component I [Planctomycetota bacterium]|nr:MAG: aminodeoxychorismate synthase component I [Planctomycetota bacterium]REK31302.1 MAG: aminodeoxychorismate synthase component I [Planctomycetota bacterium]REK37332.1 MAG: aminodeoxychorismate synthase component I [Planctomycetota bacterium]
MPGTSSPVVEEVSPAPDVFASLSALADRPGVVLLESARRVGELGRSSFLTAEPRRQFVLEKAECGVDPFAPVREALAEFHAATIPGLPPFQGGAAGLLSYELGRCWERLPQPELDDFGIPALVVGIYDWVLAWDHSEGRAWLIAHDFDGDPRKRIASVKRMLGDRSHKPNRDAMSERLTPRGTVHALDGHPGLFSNFSRESYLDAVETVIGYIEAGDVFQANLAQRLATRARHEPLELYRRLRTCNPAPFAGFFAHEDWTVLSSSPERFMRLDDGVVETRPIKGTRQRRPAPEADLFTRDELRESDKDRAENVMIVDLLRNDLSRVCKPGSIRVPQLCAVETYETVQHLVSEVRGELRDGRDFFDLLAAAFPGGSITGAPKIRAMEIITEMERLARGPYCGSLFYAGFDGQADSNILIRTLVQRGGWVSCGVGGGIVAQSDPVAEYAETLHKAAGLLRALADE